MTSDSLKTYYENILASIQDGIIVVSNDYAITTFNPAIEEMSGISSSHVIGKSLESVFSGESRLVELTGKTIGSGVTYSDSDFQIIRRRDRKPFPVSLVISPLSDENGNTTGAILVLRDMTRARELEDTLKKADRLASLGTLAAGMAHEIKNPLGGLRGAAQLLKEETGDEKYKEYLDVIIKEADRVNSLVENLLNLSGPKPLKLKSVNIHKILDGVLLLEKGILTESGIKVIRIYDPSIPSVIADEGQITQVLLNIVKNAAEAMPNGGELTLITKIFYDYIIIPPHPPLRKGGGGELGRRETKMVLVEVLDTGGGFQEDALSQVFTPFFSTKSKGTGLGLAVSHKIVEDHRGRIKVQNRTDGKGAAVQVFLPIA
ncbi:MAG: PAS domain S-box protein [Nitrospinae bacterium]|nr:PAS domain S-box protein [Nitrospinota bacterium]